MNYKEFMEMNILNEGKKSKKRRNNKKRNKNPQINNNSETSNRDTEKKEENPKLAEIKEIKRMLSDGNADNNKEALERMLELFEKAKPNEKVSKEKIEQDKKKIEDDLINKAETLDKKLEKGEEDFQAAATSLKTESLKSFKQFILNEGNEDLKKILKDLFSDLENLYLTNSELDNNGSGNQLQVLFSKFKEYDKELPKLTKYLNDNEVRFAKTTSTFKYAVLCMYSSLGEESTKQILRIINEYGKNEFLKLNFEPANIQQISNEKKLANDWLFKNGNIRPEFNNCFNFLKAIHDCFILEKNSEEFEKAVNSNSIGEYLTEFAFEISKNKNYKNHIETKASQEVKNCYETLLSKAKKEDEDFITKKDDFDSVEKVITKSREQYGFSTPIPTSFPRPKYGEEGSSKNIEDYFKSIKDEFMELVSSYSNAKQNKIEKVEKEIHPKRVWEESLRNALILNNTINEGVINNIKNAGRIAADKLSNDIESKSNLFKRDYKVGENGKISGIEKIENLDEKYKKTCQDIIKLHQEKCEDLFKKSIGTKFLSKKAIKGEKRFEYIEKIRHEMLETKRELSELFNKYKKAIKGSRNLIGRGIDALTGNGNLDWNQREYKEWTKKGERDEGLNDLISMLNTDTNSKTEDIAKWIFSKMIVTTSSPNIFEKLLESKFSSTEVKEALGGRFHFDSIFDIDKPEALDLTERPLGVIAKFTVKPKSYSTPMELFNAKLPKFATKYNLDSLKALHTELHQNNEEGKLKNFSEKMNKFFEVQEQITKVFEELKEDSTVSETMFKRMKEKFLLNENALDSQIDSENLQDISPNPYDVEAEKQAALNREIDFLKEKGKTSQNLNSLFGEGDRISITGSGPEDCAFLQQMVRTNFCLIKPTNGNFYLLNITFLEELKTLYKQQPSNRKPINKDIENAQQSDNKQNVVDNKDESEVVPFNQEQLEKGTLTTPTAEAIAKQMAGYGSSINTEKKKATVTTAACDSTYPVSAKQNKDSTTITYQNGPFKIVRRKFN